MLVCCCWCIIELEVILQLLHQWCLSVGICVVCQPLDILAVGRESSLLRRLLCYGASFSARHIHHSATGSHLTASLVTDKHGSASVFVEDEFSSSAFLARSKWCLCSGPGRAVGVVRVSVCVSGVARGGVWGVQTPPLKNVKKKFQKTKL